jgi:ribosomal protein L5
LGLEQIIFPSDIDKVNKISGMDVRTTTAKTLIKETKSLMAEWDYLLKELKT